MAYDENMPSGNQRMCPNWRNCWSRIGLVLLIAPTVILVVLGVYLAVRFGSDVPEVYADIEEHFKYGSTGGEHESGFPYWIFQAMPQICSKHLPGRGYQSLGMIFEEGRSLPVGMSKRHYMGLDRTFLNCAVCHASTVRDTPQSKARVIVGMPANTFDIMGFQNFFFDCAKDEKFNAEYVIPEVRRLLKENHKLHPEADEDLDFIDRYVVYPVAISLMRERLIMLGGRFAWAKAQHPWGPGRVDTFNAAKVLFNIPVHKLPARELNAPADFPSIWNQRPREGMQLHWDGNNTKVEERNKSAAFGTGTTPPTIDLKAIGRVEKWLLDKRPPEYPYPIDGSKAARGAVIYKEYCAECHGAGPRDFSGKQVGKVTAIEEIRTDRRRLDSYTYLLAVNQSTLYAGYDWRFTHFRKTFGYANMPLDGAWLRAPYLHNGSVPNLRELLKPAADRVKEFYRGYDVYDPVNVGFSTSPDQKDANRYFKFDTKVDGNGNAGHEGRIYGTQLGASDKDALLEFLKTF
jgi:RoxA-like, cytochrome c-like